MFRSAGTYIVGVEAQCALQGAGYTGLVAQETITIKNYYTTPIVNVLGNIAENAVSYGNRPSFPCEATGRIQLHITGGNFPYIIRLVNTDLNETVRIDTIETYQNNGLYDDRADYRYYYTFDSLPSGNYRFYFNDACGFRDTAPSLIHTIEDVQIPMLYSMSIYGYGNNYYTSSGNIRVAFNWFYFSLGDNKDYLYDKYKENLQYRVCYGSLDTSNWKPFPMQNLHLNDNYYIMLV